MRLSCTVRAHCRKRAGGFRIPEVCASLAQTSHVGTFGGVRTRRDVFIRRQTSHGGAFTAAISFILVMRRAAAKNKPIHLRPAIHTPRQCLGVLGCQSSSLGPVREGLFRRGRNRFTSPNSAARDCLMSSSRRAKRSGLVSGFVTPSGFPGLPPHKRRLIPRVACRHRADSPCR